MTLLGDILGATTIPGVHPETGAWWLDVGADETAAGRTVDESATISFSAVYSGIRFIAEVTARLPMSAHERIERDGRKASRVADDRPEHQIVHLGPNEEMSTGDWREALVAQAILRGAGYSQILRDERGRGRAHACRFHDARRVEPRRSGVNKTGPIVYDIEDKHGDVEATIPARNMIHLKNFSLNGLQGIGFVDVAREAVGLGLAGEHFGARFFGRYMRPSGFLKTDKKFKDPKVARRRITEMLRQEHGGENIHGIGVLEEGMEFQKMGITPDEAQFFELRGFQVVEIARFLRVPPHVLMHLVEASYNNVEELGREVLRYCLDPWMVRLEQELTRKLFVGEESRFFVKHNRNALARANMKERFESYRVGLEHGVYSPNEVRELEDLDPYEGGDERRTPMNMESATATRERTQRAFVALADAAVDRLVDRERRALKLALQREADPRAFLEAARSFYQNHRAFVDQVVLPIADAAAQALGAFDTVELARAFSVQVERTGMRALARAAEASATHEAFLQSWEQGRHGELLEDFSERLAGAVRPVQTPAPDDRKESGDAAA